VRNLGVVAETVGGVVSGLWLSLSFEKNLCLQVYANHSKSFGFSTAARLIAAGKLEGSAAHWEVEPENHSQNMALNISGREKSRELSHGSINLLASLLLASSINQWLFSATSPGIASNGAEAVTGTVY
jgi:hypothetical protein